VGEWSIDNAVALDSVAWPHVISLKDVLRDRAKVEISKEQEEDVRCGRDIDIEIQPNTLAWSAGLPVAILMPAKDGSRRAHARKVL